MMYPVFATQAGADLLLKTLETATSKGSNLLDSVWSLLLQGDLYRVISGAAGTLLIVPLSMFLINFFRNKSATSLDDKHFTGDFLSFLLVGLIISGIAFPTRTGSLLFAGRTSSVKFSNHIGKSVSSIAGDPNAAMASIVAGQTANASGMQVCNRIADELQRVGCINELRKSGEAAAKAVPSTANGKGIDFGSVVRGAIIPIAAGTAIPGLGPLINAGNILAGNPATKGVVGAAGSFLADSWILTALVPLLLSLGTAFILLTEAGQLVCCLMVPFVLLFGIAQPSYISKWLNSFLGWALCAVAYKLIMISIAFGMMSVGFTDIILYALIAGLGAPWLAVESINGTSFGLLRGAGSMVSTLIRFL
jgi:hypothetical protein